MKQICPVCFHHCVLEDGQTGFCRGRKNIGGEIECINYGRITSMALDPIEKKPLRRYYPGRRILSVGSFGCNFACPFGQNYQISMAGGGACEESEAAVASGHNAAGRASAASGQDAARKAAGVPGVCTEFMTPEQLVARAVSLETRGNIGLAYTYNEPLIGYEFVRDCAMLARERGLKNVVVTNGSLNVDILDTLLSCIDAFNVDLKGFTDVFYRKIGGSFKDVQRFICRAAKESHVEVTTLIIPGENDTEAEMSALSGWLAAISADIVLHVSRFFPCYKMTDRSPTSVGTVYRLAEVARKNLRYVYAGTC